MCMQQLLETKACHIHWRLRHATIIGDWGMTQPLKTVVCHNHWRLWYATFIEDCGMPQPFEAKACYNHWRLWYATTIEDCGMPHSLKTVVCHNHWRLWYATTIEDCGMPHLLKTVVCHNHWSLRHAVTRPAHLKGVLAGSRSPLYLSRAGPLIPTMVLPLDSGMKSGGGLANRSSFRVHACCHCSSSLSTECMMGDATGSSEGTKIASGHLTVALSNMILLLKKLIIHIFLLWYKCTGGFISSSGEWQLKEENIR